ncbi:grasp-with-spasm system ATP-grasp peptide maturase [Tenacibaculum ovolyticum]|uniref:grasp-with-spasm system ATP-grasp peptide maturase n=1 Tax=Tenacibaculum ovolyticum TaxID=104270 RepID=UPI0007EDE433|nr:grasp-with-spasm system ATP-grasp peptide maturase [Tenacibaculum ovolyticum]
MILIISKRNEASTEDVINWLNYQNKKYFRIDKEDNVIISYIGKDIVFQLNSYNIKLSEITTVWYRRGGINNDVLNNKKVIDNNFLDFLRIESMFLKEYIYYLLSKKKKLNSYSTSFINKLIVSDIAEEVGFLTPNTYIINSKKSFLVHKKKEKLITKTISGNPILHINNKKGAMYTNIVKDIEEDFFYPSLFQNAIDKKYELRVFYLNGKTYSMAIFSQHDKTTSVDFRNYNHELPNRTVPFILPSKINFKLKKLMDKLNINSGSIDIIVSKKNEYYFLEVNPVGQFGMISYPCNYNLENKIATYLT